MTPPTAPSTTASSTAPSNSPTRRSTSATAPASPRTPSSSSSAVSCTRSGARRAASTRWCRCSRVWRSRRPTSRCFGSCSPAPSWRPIDSTRPARTSNGSRTTTAPTSRPTSSTRSRCAGSGASPTTSGHLRKSSHYLYEHLRPFAGTFNWSGQTITDANDLGLAVIAATLGRADDADRHFAAAIALCERAGSRANLARSHFWWARVLADRGDASTAREHAEAAIALGEELGMDWTIRRRPARARTTGITVTRACRRSRSTANGPNSHQTRIRAVKRREFTSKAPRHRCCHGRVDSATSALRASAGADLVVPGACRCARHELRRVLDQLCETNGLGPRTRRGRSTAP